MQKHPALSSPGLPGFVQLAETLRKIQRNAALSKDDQLALSLAADTLTTLPLAESAERALAQGDASTCAAPAAPEMSAEVPAEVLAAAQRLATPLHESRVAPGLKATMAEDQRGADLVLAFLRSLDASAKTVTNPAASGRAAAMTSEQIEMDLWPQLRLSGSGVTLHDTLCVVRAYEAHVRGPASAHPESLVPREECWACGGTRRVTTSSNGSGLVEEQCTACEDTAQATAQGIPPRASVAAQMSVAFQHRREQVSKKMAGAYAALGGDCR